MAEISPSALTARSLSGPPPRAFSSRSINPVTKTPVPLTILFISLVLPVSFSLSLGGLFLPPYRLALIVLLPMAIAEIGKKRIRLTAPDYFVIAFVILQAVSMTIQHGLTDQITVINRRYTTVTTSFVNSGAMALESLAPYLIVRAYITTKEQFILACRTLLMVVLAVAALAAIESVTGYSIFRLGRVIDEERMRFGLHRAAGPFPHAILWGLFAASTLPFAAMGALGNKTTLTRCLVSFAIIIAAVTSVSSAAIGLLGMQIILLTWIVMTGRIQQRWAYFAVGCIFAYFFIDIFSNRTPVQVIFNYTALNPWTGYYRTLIWQYGWQDFLTSPIIGIGYNDWVRPNWMSPSIDAFWLVILLRYGLLGAVPLALAVITAVYKVNKASAPSVSDSIRNLDPGFWWIISITTLSVAAFTVHFWAQSFVYFFILIGFWGALAADVKTRTKPRNRPAFALSKKDLR